MEEQDFETLSPEEKERIKTEKEEKSRVRIFWLVAFICVVLFGILIYEVIVLLNSPKGINVLSDINVIDTLKNILKNHL